MDGCAVLQQHIHAPVTLGKSFHAVSQRQLYPVLADFAVNKGCHIGIKGVHQLFGSLDDGHIQPQMAKILRHFQTDEAATHHHCGLGIVLG